jgi:phosphomannomutase
MKIDETIFKAYDIRGTYSEQIDKDFAYNLGRAYAEFMRKEVGHDKLNLAVSRDMRLSSPELAEAVIEGISAQGVKVIDLGMLSTPSLYYAVDTYHYAGGIQVSASHNPANYNGFKLVREKAIPISKDTGITKLKEMMKSHEFVSADKPGTIERADELAVLGDHIYSSLDLVEIDQLKPFRVVIDAANAMGGPLFSYLFKELPCELIELNFELDGTFPAHEADPLKDENNKQLQDKVLEEKADLGIALDGDSDRIFFVDDKGKTVEPAIIRGILSKIFLKDNKGAKICYDIRPGKITEDMIVENGGEPVVTKVGHSLIKEKAREVGAIFAGESSGHFFLKVGDAIYERPMIMALKIMIELSKSGQKFSEYIKPLQKYFHSGEINFDVDDKTAVFDRLKEKYGDNLKYDFDGLSFEFDDFWFNVRASNTENKVRLNLEARTQEVMEEKRDEVMTVIKAL